MEIGNMFGIKVKRLELKGDYQTMQELYERLRDVSFEAGEPSLVKNGPEWIIAFPEVDGSNQVQILGNRGRYSVRRSSRPAGVDRFACNRTAESLTGLSEEPENARKTCIVLVGKTADTINGLGI